MALNVLLREHSVKQTFSFLELMGGKYRQHIHPTKELVIYADLVHDSKGAFSMVVKYTMASYPQLRKFLDEFHQ